jgi:hypothetical protein
MTYVNFLFLLICHITFFLKLIGCLNPMIKYDWLAEVSTLMWLVHSAIRAEIALLLTNQIAGNTIDFKMNIIKSDIFRRFFISKNILKKISCYHDNYFRYFMFGECTSFVSKARVSACMYFLVCSSITVDAMEVLIKYCSNSFPQVA